MNENRLIDIESKLAHQEHLLDELNQAVTDQQARIHDLEELGRHLLDRLRAVGEGGTAESADDERPPHY